MGDVGGVPVGGQQADLAGGHAQLLPDEGLVGALLEDLLVGVDEDRDVAGGQAQDLVGFGPEVLALVHEHELERVPLFLPRPDDGQDVPPDFREIDGFAALRAGQSPTEILLVDRCRPEVERRDRLVGKAQELEAGADVFPDDIGEDEGAVPGGLHIIGRGQVRGAVDEDLRLPRPGRAEDEPVLVGRHLHDAELIRGQLAAVKEPGRHEGLCVSLSPQRAGRGTPSRMSSGFFFRLANS